MAKRPRPEIRAVVRGCGSGQRSALCPFEARYITLQLDDGRIVKWWTETGLPGADAWAMRVVLNANITDENTIQHVRVLACTKER